MTKEVVIRPKRPWFSQEVKQAKLERRKLERKWKKSCSVFDREAFIRQKSLTNWLIQKNKADYYNAVVAASKGNQKSLFMIMNNLIKKPTSTPLPDSSSDRDLANEFAQYFTTKIENIRKSFTTKTVDDTIVQSNISAPEFVTYQCDL